MAQQSEGISTVEQVVMPENEEEVLLIDDREIKQRKIKKYGGKIWKYTKNNKLLILTIVSVVIGIILGIAIAEAHPSKLVQQLIAFPGELFLRALKMLILPLIVFSLIAGLGSLNIKMSGALGLRTILYYTTTTFIAVTLGIILVVSIQPGKGHGTIPKCTNASHVSTDPLEIVDSILDLLRNIIPDNLFTATFVQTQTQYTTIIDWRDCVDYLENMNSTIGVKNIINNTSNMSCSELSRYMMEEVDVDLIQMCPVEVDKSLGTRDGMNILGVIVFTIAFAVVLSSLGEEAQKFIKVIGVLNDAIMKLVTLVMWYSPIGIASIIIGKLLEVNSLSDVIQELGLYVVCVLLGLFIHGCIILPTLYTILAWSNPLKLVRGVLQALLVAFGTSSSSATLPVTIQCLEDNLGFDQRVTRFMLPVGATVNMDGTALYEAVAAVFIAQANSASVGFDRIIIIAITATLASIGAAGVPQAGLVTLIIVLTAIGLPAEEVALILAVDWFLDRFRTTVNVFGDCVGVGIVTRFSKKQLSKPQTTPPSHQSENPSDKVDSTPTTLPTHKTISLPLDNNTMESSKV